MQSGPWRLGLTGGIGSGKSTVAQFLRQCGAILIDADAVSREVTGPGGAALEPIKLAFGDEFIHPETGLDRGKMRQLAFTSPKSRAALESIIHPLVGAEMQRQLVMALNSDTRCIVMDIPLLFESKRWRSTLDRILVVDCSEATQVQRVHDRSGLEIDAIHAIIASQSSRAQRIAGADLILYNDGITREELGGQVREIACEFGL